MSKVATLVWTLSDSTQSQESKSEVRIMTHLDNTLYLSSLWSDFSCASELVIAEAPATCGGHDCTVGHI